MHLPPPSTNSLAGYQTGIMAYTIFGICAAAMHLGSCAAHVYPDSHSLEKLDHFGITGGIMGTAISALVAMQHGGPIPRGMLYACAVLFVCAMMRPLPRVIGFAVTSVAIVVAYAKTVANWNLAAQLLIYFAGAWCFLRCVVVFMCVEIGRASNLHRNGGHNRWFWLADHHLLHYAVTSACLLHLVYINNALKETL